MCFNPKLFWSYVAKNQNRDGLPNFMFFINIEINSGQDIVNIFVKYFSNVFNKSYK